MQLVLDVKATHYANVYTELRFRVFQGNPRNAITSAFPFISTNFHWYYIDEFTAILLFDNEIRHIVLYSFLIDQ